MRSDKRICLTHKTNHIKGLIMKVLRKIIEIDEELCDGCGQCIPSCAEGALEIVDGKAQIITDKLCDGLGACLGECPTGALKVIEREADDFDEEAVEKHLAEKEKETRDCRRKAADALWMSVHSHPDLCPH
jgi:ferredoxin